MPDLDTVLQSLPPLLADTLREALRDREQTRQQEQCLARERAARHWVGLLEAVHADLGDLYPFASLANEPPAEWSLGVVHHAVWIRLPRLCPVLVMYEWRLAGSMGVWTRLPGWEVLLTPWGVAKSVNGLAEMLLLAFDCADSYHASKSTDEMEA